MERYDTEAEARLISSMLKSESACGEVLSSLTYDNFSVHNQRYFQVIQSLYEQSIRPTYIEVTKEGQKCGLFQNMNDLNDFQYVADHYIEDIENLPYWINKVKDATKYRSYTDFLTQQQYIVEAEDIDITDVILSAEETLTNLTALDVDESIDTPQHLAEIGYAEVERRFTKMEELRQLHNGVRYLEGLNTGFHSLNNVTLGYKPGDLVILGAQTGHGKTTYALNSAKQIAIIDRRNMLYLNTEMSKKQVALKLGSMLSGVDHDKVRSGDLTATELSIVYEGYNKLDQSGFYSFPCPNLTPQKLISITRQFKVQKHIDILVVDYIGRMDKLDPRLQEWQVLEQIVKTMKLLAQQLNIVVLGLVQLNPDGTLQGSKRIKNECDLMLYLKPIGREEKDSSSFLSHYPSANYWLEVDKNRDGKAGFKIPLLFDLEKQQIVEAERRG